MLRYRKGVVVCVKLTKSQKTRHYSFFSVYRINTIFVTRSAARLTKQQFGETNKPRYNAAFMKFVLSRASNRSDKRLVAERPRPTVSRLHDTSS